MFRFILFVFVGFCSSYFFRNSTVCPPKQGGQRERCQVERLCQGWLLFNELLLKGRRVPNFFQDELACGIARFMTRLFLSLSCLHSDWFGSSFLLTSLWVFPECCGAILHPQDAVLTNSAVALALSSNSPGVRNHFTEHTVKAFSWGRW